jgi:hypothetical protein
MAEKKRKGPRPKFGETMTEQIKLSMPKNLLAGIENNAKAEGYVYHGGTVDYVRHILAQVVNGVVIVPSPENAAPGTVTQVTWPEAADDETTD